MLSTAQLLMTENLSLPQCFFAILITYFGGVLASLTPCVYPMIPITVSVIGGLDGGLDPERKGSRKALALMLTYLAGMSVVYSLLGVAAGVSGKVFGSITNTSSGYLFISVIMTLSALHMLEVVQINFSQGREKIENILKQKRTPRKPLSRNSGFFRSFILGASSGMIAAPCTTPVLTSILAYIARTQSVGLGFVLMLSFSLGLGTLLVVIAIFAQALQILPKSGKWMKSIKVLSGLILLAFAQYLIYRAGSLGGPLL
jgi:cytochrome c-type biogenesis protein